MLTLKLVFHVVQRESQTQGGVKVSFLLGGYRFFSLDTVDLLLRLFIGHLCCRSKAGQGGELGEERWDPWRTRGSRRAGCAKETSSSDREQTWCKVN